MGAFSINVPLTVSFISSSTISIHSASTRSTLVIAMIPLLIPNIFRISKCSNVWGIMPSSAAITSNTKSIPPIPANIFLINLSWPGTSIIPILIPLGFGMLVKPKSMVIPRFFSSFKRSVSLPVKALIKLVFP